MSYCRMGWGGADAYVYPSVLGGITCHCAEGVQDLGPEEMIKHLEKRIAAGDRIPDNVIPDIRRDIAHGRFDNDPVTAREDGAWQ